jgi:hypothetical protein
MHGNVCPHARRSQSGTLPPCGGVSPAQPNRVEGVSYASGPKRHQPRHVSQATTPMHRGHRDGACLMLTCQICFHPDVWYSDLGFLLAEAIMPVQSQLSNDPVTICVSVLQRLSPHGSSRADMRAGSLFASSFRSLKNSWSNMGIYYIEFPCSYSSLPLSPCQVYRDSRAMIMQAIYIISSADLELLISDLSTSDSQPRSHRLFSPDNPDSMLSRQSHPGAQEVELCRINFCK